MEARVEPPEVVLSRARRRATVLAVLTAVTLGAIGIRSAALCVSPHDQTITLGSTQRWEQMVLKARRGSILDRNGDPLVVSVDTPSVIVDPELVEPQERGQLARRVAHILDAEPDEIQRKMSRSGRYARLASRVHPRIAAEVLDIGHKALFVESDQRRYYTEGELGGHVLGFVNSEGEGQSGVEAALDPWLRGTSVLLQRRRDRRGLDVDRLRDVDRVSSAGMDVQLTLDRRLQHITERALDNVMERHKPVAATAVVMDPRTGEVLALANTPSFNPNALSEDAEARRNRAVVDAIEPGSVLKPFVAAAAVEEGKVQISTLIDCENGRWRVGRSRIGDDHPQGVITVSEVIKYSSNIGSAKLAFMLGAETYLSYMKAFGFGEQTGIELPAERTGRMRAADKIKPIELATTSYGHGITVTAVQLASAVSAIANDGVRMKPRLVREVVDEDGVPALVREPEPLQRVISSETATAITRAMVTVTEKGGTATRARVPGFNVAGKTGTAWKIKDGKYSDGRIGSFVGFVPAEDPRLAIVVIVDEPTVGSRYGGIVAAPAFAEIASQSLRTLGVAPDPELLPTSHPARRAPPAIVAAPAPSVRKTIAVAADERALILPDLSGQTMREALATLQGTGLQLELLGSGRVARVEPEPGVPVHPGTPVRLTFN
ncbi:MAG: PASTA domain-containing protein [Deltaproteobacteria bacterium]|nr:MAG: PASTA domain-containing protein [Deltaproteobacteria bacterium]